MPTYEEVEVTPELAAKWLDECNHMNRSIRWHKVDEYARIMTEGGWKLNGAGFTFDTENVLVDGQHRAWAVKKSGVTITTLVTRNVLPGVRPTVDENIRRQFADDLSMNGVRNSHQNATLLRKILVWKANGGLADLNKVAVGRPVLASKWAEHAHDITTTIKDTHRWKLRWPGNKGALDFMYWLLMFEEEMNQARVEQFFQNLTIGSQAAEDKLLVHVVDELAGRGKYRTERFQTGVSYQVFWLIRGWNGWLRGDKLSRLALPHGGLADPYPDLVRAYRLK